MLEINLNRPAPAVARDIVGERDGLGAMLPARIGILPARISILPAASSPRRASSARLGA